MESGGSEWWMWGALKGWSFGAIKTPGKSQLVSCLQRLRMRKRNRILTSNW